MGLLSRKYRPVAVPLAMPLLDRVPMPDGLLLRRYADRLQMTNDVALEQAQHPDVREFCRELAVGLYERFDDKITDFDTSAEDDERLLGVVGVSVCSGMGYSAVDDGLGIDKGLTEQCTVAALHMGYAKLGGLPGPWRLPLMFSMQAGHYMGRVGRATMPSLLAQADA